MTTNNANTQKFSTNPYSESIQKLKSQGKLAAKVTGYTLLSVTAATALIWQSYHWYIEYFLSRSPASLNYKAKLLLHGAYFREHVAPDYGMAAFYLEQVLQVALDEQQLDEQDPDLIQLRLRLAYDEWHAGHLFDAITQYTRAWTLLVATTPSSLSTRHHDDMITTAKHLGDLYTRVGDSEKAEEYLTWAFYAVTKPESNNVGDNNGTRLRKINIICSLASLYAMQRQFHLALPLFLQALQSIPDNDDADADSKNGGDGDEQWLCMKAILQNQLSETFYGMGKPKESMGWAQAALSSSSDGMAKYSNAKDCRECGGVVSNNLGKLLEIKGEFDQALVYYKQAQMYASTMDDTSSQMQYDENVVRLEKLTHKDEENATLAQDLLGSKKEDIANNQSKEQQQGWVSWLGGRGDKKKDTK
ncbi:hypothetical protein BCR42DRAFT_458996 [Absidia repens]|uniref:TPR-like protein n=1 Tax=Absidia repens TaxID=90262 RepID=A0A1X2IVP1_9FUNG|nr:hypothetical protein BCR42DRAFT_458996 [Absidia repens]